METAVLQSYMSVHLGIHMKRFAGPLVIDRMIIIIVAYAAISFFFFAPNFVAKAFIFSLNWSFNLQNKQVKFFRPGGVYFTIIVKASSIVLLEA